MKTSIAFMTLALALASTVSGAEPAFTIVALPRPNSGTFSSEQAGARRSEVLSNAPNPKLENWRNPYMGFCIHIGKDDRMTVYGHWLKSMPEYSKPRTSQSVAEIKKLADEIPLYGNPAGILITSDLPLKHSKTIHEILTVLFVPSIQLFYARSGEPDGAAGRSQSVRPETNRTPVAAASCRTP